MEKRARHLLLLLPVVALWAVVAVAQTAAVGQEHREKLSITTQMFLDEMSGDISFAENADLKLGSRGMLPEPTRRYAAPEVIDGKAYIPSFVWVDGEDDIALLEREGVIVEERFDAGLLTTLIPIDRIEEIAGIPGVKRIEVSSVMQPATDEARKTTRVGDVLGYTEAAVAANLPKGYDGSGVIVGVIDRGIDMDHIAFKDKDGNTRIKRAYVYNGSKAIYYYGEGPLPQDNVTNTLNRGRLERDCRRYPGDGDRRPCQRHLRRHGAWRRTVFVRH